MTKWLPVGIIPLREICRQKSQKKNQAIRHQYLHCHSLGKHIFIQFIEVVDDDDDAAAAAGAEGFGVSDAGVGALRNLPDESR